MTLLILANAVLFIGAMIGMVLLAHQRKEGFIVFFFVEASMTYIGYETHNHGLIYTALLYIIMNIYSYYKWSKIDNRGRDNG